MNDVKLQEGHPVDENLRPIKVGGKSTAIETAQHGNGARINGDLSINGNIYSDTVVSGTILGYTNIGLNETNASYTLTTSYVVPTDEFSVSFVAPPSGNVEIFAHISFNSGSTGAGDLHVGLSTQNATSTYLALESYHEEKIIDGSGRSGIDLAQIYWTLTGLTAGTSYEYWAGFKSSSVIGTPVIQWGGNASNRFPDFIMKATALPATIYTG